MVYNYTSYSHNFFLLLPPPSSSTLFPYTTLFRSKACGLAVSDDPGCGRCCPVQRRFLEHCTLDFPGFSRFSLHCRSEEHTSELQSHHDLVCRLLLEKKK